MNKLIPLAAAVALAAAAGAHAQDLSVEEIVEKTNHVAYYQGDDGKARVKMTIHDEGGGTRMRDLTILRKDTGEGDTEQKFFVYFHEPADVRGMTYMVWKHVGADDDRWLYLPALDVIKRIAASDERTQFVGSHFFYEDVSGRGLEEDYHELVETNDTYYVLKHTPKEPEEVEFDSYTMWVHKDSFIPVRVQYEQGGEVYRQVDALEVEDIEGYKTVTKSRMRDTNIGGYTMMEYSNVAYDLGLPEDIFTERNLKNPPREYLGE